VGEKTATKLIAEFGSLENVLANIDKVAGAKLQEKLRENAELAVLSKKLATIDCAMPLPDAPRDYKPAPDAARVRELFARYEFKSLLAKVDTIFPGAGPAQAAGQAEPPPARIADTAGAWRRSWPPPAARAGCAAMRSCPARCRR
jgi:DNA polymerase-1